MRRLGLQNTNCVPLVDITFNFTERNVVLEAKNRAIMMHIILILMSQDSFVIHVIKPRKNYNLSSYRIYESQIRSITECMVCADPVSHNKEEGSHQCTAFIDQRP